MSVLNHSSHKNGAKMDVSASLPSSPSSSPSLFHLVAIVFLQDWLIGKLVIHVVAETRELTYPRLQREIRVFHWSVRLTSHRLIIFGARQIRISRSDIRPKVSGGAALVISAPPFHVQLLRVPTYTTVHKVEYARGDRYTAPCSMQLSQLRV